MKLVVQVKLMPEAGQATALVATLRTVNEAANWVSAVAFEQGVPREYDLRKYTYAQLKSRGLGAQAAQHTIKKVRDAYTTLKANIKAGNLGRAGSKPRKKAESKPVAFRPEAAQPYDDRCLSWQLDAQTVSIWTTAGRIRGVRFVCSADGLKMLQQYRKGESDLTERDGVLYLIATCEVPEENSYEPDRFIGVDLGIVNIATTSTGYQAAGRGLNRRRTRERKLRGKLQKKNTKSAKRRLKARARKEQCHVRNTNHVIAKRIVAEAERTSAGIALEDLGGIRQRVRLRKPGGTSHALKAVGEGHAPFLGLRPARRVHRVQGTPSRRARGSRRPRPHLTDVLRVRARRQEEPGRPGPLHLPELRGRCPRGPERFPQHRPTWRRGVECGA